MAYVREMSTTPQYDTPFLFVFVVYDVAMYL